MHFTFLTSQGWAHPTTASLAAASTKLPQHAGSPVHWPASFPAADDPATQQLIALLRSRAARWSTVRRSLWVLRLPFSMHRAVCRLYAPPAWPKCRDVNLRMRTHPTSPRSPISHLSRLCLALTWSATSRCHINSSPPFDSVVPPDI